MRIIAGLLLAVVFSCAASGQNSKSKMLAQPFAAPSIDGQNFDITQMKGKVVLLTFWSTRCPICAAETPKLNQLAAHYKNKDVVFLGLTTDNESKVKAHLRKKPFDFNILPNSFGLLLKYADKDKDGNISMGYPAYFLINQKGEIELKTNGWDKTEMLDTRINHLLASF